MVTILPIDIDEDFVREGLAYAAGERIASAAKQLAALAVELQADGLVSRTKLDEAFARVNALQEMLKPVLEYAKMFEDQWPPEPEDGVDGAEA